MKPTIYPGSTYLFYLHLTGEVFWLLYPSSLHSVSCVLILVHWRGFISLDNSLGFLVLFGFLSPIFTCTNVQSLIWYGNAYVIKKVEKKVNSLLPVLDLSKLHAFWGTWCSGNTYIDFSRVFPRGWELWRGIIIVMFIIYSLLKMGVVMRPQYVFYISIPNLDEVGCVENALEL